MPGALAVLFGPEVADQFVAADRSPAWAREHSEQCEPATLSRGPAERLAVSDESTAAEKLKSQHVYRR